MSNAEYLRAWKAANPEKVAAYARQDALRHPKRFKAHSDKFRERHKERLREEDKLKKRRIYRTLTPEEKAARYAKVKAVRQAEQEKIAGRKKSDKCEICSGQLGGIVFDHCHRTGKFRG